MNAYRVGIMIHGGFLLMCTRGTTSTYNRSDLESAEVNCESYLKEKLVRRGSQRNTYDRGDRTCPLAQTYNKLGGATYVSTTKVTRHRKEAMYGENYIGSPRSYLLK
jgi:hypothetical protein